MILITFSNHYDNKMLSLSISISLSLNNYFNNDLHTHFRAFIIASFGTAITYLKLHILSIFAFMIDFLADIMAGNNYDSAFQ